MLGEASIFKKAPIFLVIILIGSMLVIFVPLHSAHGGYVSISIDGNFSDWSGVPVLVSDAGDEYEPYDIAECYMANTQNWIYIRIDRVAQGGESTSLCLKTYLDTDRNPSTGYTGFPVNDIGADYYLSFVYSGYNQLWKRSGDSWIFVRNCGYAFGSAGSRYGYETALPDSSIDDSTGMDVVFYCQNVNDKAPDSGHVSFFPFPTAYVEDARTDKSEYQFGETITVEANIDTYKDSQNIKWQAELFNPNWALRDTSSWQYYTVYDAVVDYRSVDLQIPTSGIEGEWKVKIKVYDSGTNEQEDEERIYITVYGNPSEIELYYDDGIADDGYAPTLGLYWYTVHFQTPTATPYKLSKVKYYVYSDPASFYVDIRDASLQQLYYGLVTPTATGWFVFDLSSEEIFVQGDFYVGMKYSQLYEPELGADYTDPDGESGEGLYSFPTPNLSSLDWMIRAVLGENQPPTAYIDDIHPSPAIEGETVYFSGYGLDPDGSIVGWRWESSIDGPLSSSSSFDTSSLSVGEHTISFSVKDDAGVWSLPDTESLTIGLATVSVSISSRTLEGQTNIGSITFDGQTWSLPVIIYEYKGTYQATANLPNGYRFNSWEYSGSISVSDPSSQTTDVTVSGVCSLTAVFEMEPYLEFMPYWKFSQGEQYYPVSFYFDNDIDVENNLYDYNIGSWEDACVYIHIEESDNYYTIQYWLYYVYQPLGKLLPHQHDWDSTIYVILDAQSHTPLKVRFYRHFWPKTYDWEDVEHDGTHMIAYVAEDSHGVYKDIWDMLLPPVDGWVPGGITLGHENITNWVTVKEDNGHMEILVDGEYRWFCDIDYVVLKGEHPVPGTTFWPRYFPIPILRPIIPNVDDAPWHRPDWNDPDPQTSNDLAIFEAHSPVDLHVYDPEGLHVGVNETGEIEIEIPGALYSGPESDPEIIIIPAPIYGNYTTLILGTETGTYNYTLSRILNGIETYDEGHINVEIEQNETQTITSTVYALADIAVTELATYKTIIGQGYILHINVTITNYGSFSETFNVTAYANATIVSQTEVILTTGNSTTITVTWDTAGVTHGNYTISAYTWPVSGEIDTADNTLVADEEVCVTIPGDVDGDFNVDLYDAVKLLVIYGVKKDNPKYDPNCDIDGDGDIDLYDVVILLTHYGQKDP